MNEELKYFLPHQREWLLDQSPPKLMEKSHQIGKARLAIPDDDAPNDAILPAGIFAAAPLEGMTLMICQICSCDSRCGPLILPSSRAPVQLITNRH